MRAVPFAKAQHRYPTEVPATVEEQRIYELMLSWLEDTEGVTSFLRDEMGWVSKGLSEGLLGRVRGLLRAQIERLVERVGGEILGGSAPLTGAMEQVIQSRVGELVEGINTQQKEALRRFIADGLQRGWSQTFIQQQVRAVIGLTEKQQVAVRNFYLSLSEEYTQQVAAGKASGYARRLRMTRAWAIARTESAWAYNYGRLEAWKQMEREGRLTWGGRKIWRTSSEGCEACVEMDNVAIPLNGFFDTRTGIVDAPPLHVNCRCVVDLYSAEEARGVS